MFTGIVTAVGQLAAKQSQGGDARLSFHTGSLPLDDVVQGDSICISGVCLTVVALAGAAFWADVSGETLQRTVLGELQVGAAVNLEKALLPTTRLGGHLVSGHVDGVGQVTRFYADARSWRLHIAAPVALARYIAEKGSICVDGVSLTVNGVAGTSFDLNIIPHTLQQTTLGEYRVGRRVNLEVDIIARYLERLLAGDAAAESGVSIAKLRASGFIQPE